VIGAINFHFCPSCGSSLYSDFCAPRDAERTVAVGVGKFVDPSVPMATIEAVAALRHEWVAPVPDAEQFGS